MPIVHNFDNFKNGGTLKRNANGFSDLFSKAINFAIENKEILSDSVHSISNVHNAISKINDAVKEFEKLKEIKKISEQSKNKLSKKDISQKLENKLTGHGFHKF